MPNGGGNPKVQTVIDAAKFLIAPKTEQKNLYVSLLAIAVILASGFAGFIAIVSPITIHPDATFIAVDSLLFALSSRIAVKHF